jgi:hypothetical protein
MHMTGKFLFLGACSCFLLNIPRAGAQSLRDSAMRAAAIGRTVKEYRKYISVVAPLYSGPKYTNYSQLVEKGQPFFLNNSFHTGTILYDNILYDRIPIKFDILTNRVVVADAQGNSQICPNPEKIASFSILDHSFTKLEKEPNAKNAPSPGFYEVLYANAGIKALRKETKVLRTNTEGQEVTEFITTTVNYYLKKGNTYYPVNKRSQLLDVLKDKKKELQTHIRQNNLDFIEDQDNAIKNTLRYYETLIKS